MPNYLTWLKANASWVLAVSFESVSTNRNCFNEKMLKSGAGFDWASVMHSCFCLSSNLILMTFLKNFIQRFTCYLTTTLEFRDQVQFDSSRTLWIFCSVKRSQCFGIETFGSLQVKFFENPFGFLYIFAVCFSKQIALELFWFSSLVPQVESNTLTWSSPKCARAQFPFCLVQTSCATSRAKCFDLKMTKSMPGYIFWLLSGWCCNWPWFSKVVFYFFSVSLDTAQSNGNPFVSLYIFSVWMNVDLLTFKSRASDSNFNSLSQISKLFAKIKNKPFIEILFP